MKRVSLRLGRSFSFREAFLLAFLLHLLFFAIFMYRPLEFFLPIKIKGRATPKIKGQTEPIKFTFVDIPEDRAAEARPDTPYFSDKNRLAGGPAAPKPDPSAERKPYLRGNRPDFVFRPGGVQVPARGSVQPKPPSPRIKEQEKGMKADDLKGTVPLTKGESFDPSKAQPEAKSGVPSSPSLKDTLSNLDRIIESEVFDNRRSSIDTNSAISFDTKDFDFGPYAAVLYRIVKSNWFIPYAARELGLKGVTVIRFRIMKDGRVTGLHLLRPSGIDPFDAAALNSIQLSNPLPALPEEFSRDSVGVTFSFYYNLRPPDK